MTSLIVDFGNVIAFFDHRRACRQLAALSEGHVTEDDVFRAVFESTLESEFDSGAVSSVEFVGRLRAFLRSVASDDAIVTAWCDIFAANDEVIALIARVDKTRHRLVLASNTNELHHRWFGRRFSEPLDRFDAQVLSFQVGARKPSPAFFDHCVALSGSSAAECLYIDDRSDFVDAACARGMPGIVYSPRVDLVAVLKTRGVEVR